MEVISVFETKAKFDELELYKLFKDEDLEIKSYLSLDKQYLVVTGDVKANSELRSVLYYRTNSFAYDLKNKKYLDVPSIDGIFCEKIQPHLINVLNVVDIESDKEICFFNSDFRSLTCYN